jgi:rsbT co-antagonist protein RsbR
VATSTGIGTLLKDNEASILREWVGLQLADSTRRELLSESEVSEQSRAFLASLSGAWQQSEGKTMTGDRWDDVRALLSELSKQRRTHVADAKRLNEEILLASEVLDKLGLVTVEAHQRGREQVILRQQQELLELSTPVIKLWDGIVAVPLIGTLDSERTQVVMESLLEAIVTNEATVAIIDITGVPTVDTLVAQHLLKTVAAARLMGAECIISGIRPQIAQTIVHLGVDLGDVITKSNVADALGIALAKRGLRIGAPSLARA